MTDERYGHASKKRILTDKRCCVPMCGSNSKSSETTRFFSLPKTEFRRQIVSAIESGTGCMTNQISLTSGVYICDKHYNLEEDVKFWEHCQKPGYPMRLKDGVLPHLFPAAAPPHGAGVDSASEMAKQTCDKSSMELTATSFDLVTDSQGQESALEESNSNHGTSAKAVSSKKTREASSQTSKIVMKSDCTCKESRHSRHTKQFDSPCTVSSFQSSPTKSSADISEYVHVSYSQSSTSTDFDFCDTEKNAKEKNEHKLMFMKQCEEHSKLFLGIDKNNLAVLQVLEKYINKKDAHRDALIVFRKIKGNDPFEMIGLQFGLGASQACKIFSDTLPIISKCFKNFIFRASSEQLFLNLPVAFRANYFGVSDIIDCFECAIEKPSNPLHQALSWSDYKQANTLKFFVSCTCDGQIDFISKAYGGRISDVLLVRMSGYLSFLKKGSKILADRGFKHLEEELAQHGCELLRPPSVSADGILSEKESLLTKQIAALRIHVERVIGRLRDFAMLAPHGSIDHSMLSKMDDVAIVAAGLVNLQKKITKF